MAIIHQLDRIGMFPISNGFWWCALASLASAGATFLIKMSHQAGGEWTVTRLAFLAGACAVYGVGFVSYGVALQRMQMTLAYPLMTALTMVAVFFLGTAALGEQVSTSRILGMTMVVAGAALVSR